MQEKFDSLISLFYNNGKSFDRGAMIQEYPVERHRRSRRKGTLPKGPDRRVQSAGPAVKNCRTVAAEWQRRAISNCGFRTVGITLNGLYFLPDWKLSTGYKRKGWRAYDSSIGKRSPGTDGQ
jgi:hypothetical protein